MVRQYDRVGFGGRRRERDVDKNGNYRYRHSVLIIARRTNRYQADNRKTIHYICKHDGQGQPFVQNLLDIDILVRVHSFGDGM